MELSAQKIGELAYSTAQIAKKLMGQDMGPLWEELSATTKNNISEAVSAVCEERLLSPRDVHDNWLTQMLLDGWTWGEKKDPHNKTHPEMKAWGQLNKEAELKSALFYTIARTMVAAGVYPHPNRVRATTTIIDPNKVVPIQRY